MFYQYSADYEYVATVQHPYNPWVITGSEQQAPTGCLYCELNTNNSNPLGVCTTPPGSDSYVGSLGISSNGLVEPNSAMSFDPDSVISESIPQCPGVTWAPSPLYDYESPLSALVGTWNGITSGSGASSPFMIAADGSFSEQDVGSNCVISGQFSTADPTHNLYSVSLTYSGSDCIAGTVGSWTVGIAYIDYSVDPEVLWTSAVVGTYLVFMPSQSE
jgi:hypothetical protein